MDGQAEDIATDLAKLETCDVPTLYSKSVPFPTESELTCYCDLHDLIATVDTPTQEVVVYRINGEIAYSVKRRSPDVGVSVLQWKPDGSLLGVAWSCGTVAIHSGETGKLVAQTSVQHRPPVRDWKLDLSPDTGVSQDEGGNHNMASADREDVEDDDSIPSCMGWTQHTRPRMVPDGFSPETAEAMTTEDWFRGTSNGVEGQTERSNGGASISELTSAITTIDVTRVLPRLSAIHSHGVYHGIEGNKFSSQVGTDSVFHTDETDSAGFVDTFVACSSSGHTRALVNESLTVGVVELQHQPQRHASHSECDTQVILTTSQYDRRNQLQFLDFPFNALRSPLLRVTALNTKRLLNLTAYIKQTMRCLQHDFKIGLQLPTRLIANINEELEQKSEGDLVTNLYHLAMTGMFTPLMQEWLTDIVRETNHKRWDVAVNTMYTDIQNHLFMNLKPTLDRLQVAANVLQGHARLHEDTNTFQIEPAIFDRLLESVDSVKLVAERVQSIAMIEQRQFRAFSKWLRVMIEVGIAGPGTRAATEVEEREIPNVDHNLVLAYIKDTLRESHLTYFLETRAKLQGECSLQEFFAHPVMVQMTYEHTRQVIERSHSQQRGQTLALEDTNHVSLPALTAYLAARARVALECINEWQSKMLPSPTIVLFPEELGFESETPPFELRIFPGGEKHYQSVTDLLTKAVDRMGSNLLCVHRVLRLAGRREVEFLRLDYKLPTGDITHAAMLSQKVILLLLRSEPTDDRVLLLSLNTEMYRTQPRQALKLLQVFPRRDGFEPKRFIVGGRPGKMVCVVIGSRGQEWRVLDLDAREDVNAVVGGDEAMNL